jgi:NAD(P)H-nitrite reductase large subunit
MNDPEGAILQRDMRTYAVATHLPGGVVTPEDLELIAHVCRKYSIPMLKITSGQRIALSGIEPGDVAHVLSDLGPLAKPEIAPCVKFVQACLGTDMCRYGSQDSIALAREADKKFRSLSFPSKIKIGVSGCPRSCGLSHSRDIGIMGTNRGWTVFFGGNGGARPRLGDLIARDLTSGEALDCAVRLAEYYKKNAKPGERTARFMERIGEETLKTDILPVLPSLKYQDAG